MAEPKVISSISAVTTTIVNPVSIAGGQAATKYAVSMNVANTEYSQTLPTNAKKFRIHLRDYGAFRLAYVTGLVATSVDPYESIPAGSEKYEDNLSAASLTLYFASSIAGKIAEIEAWS